MGLNIRTQKCFIRAACTDYAIFFLRGANAACKSLQYCFQAATFRVVNKLRLLCNGHLNDTSQSSHDWYEYEDGDGYGGSRVDRIMADLPRRGQRDYRGRPASRERNSLSEDVSYGIV